MPSRPISRHYDFGLTFRWVKGDSFVAVKRGYVIEGAAVIVVSEPKNPRVLDRPKETVGFDQATWVASFSIRPDDWDKPGSLAHAATEWACENRGVADWRDRPGQPVAERG